MSKFPDSPHNEKLESDRKIILDRRFTTPYVMDKFPTIVPEARKILREYGKEEQRLTDDDLVGLLKEVVSFDFVPREAWVLGVVLKAENLIAQRKLGKTKAAL